MSRQFNLIQPERTAPEMHGLVLERKHLYKNKDGEITLTNHVYLDIETRKKTFIPLRDIAGKKVIGTKAAWYQQRGDGFYYQVKGATDPNNQPVGNNVFWCGEWKRHLYNEDRLYQLFLEDPDAYSLLVEGEKDADTATELGIPAVTNLNGALHFTETDAELLRDANVVIVADNDAAGRKREQLCARLLNRKAASIRVVKLDGLSEGEDLSDWVAKLREGGLNDDK